MSQSYYHILENKHKELIPNVRDITLTPTQTMLGVTSPSGKRATHDDSGGIKTTQRLDGINLQSRFCIYL